MSDPDNDSVIAYYSIERDYRDHRFYCTFVGNFDNSGAARDAAEDMNISTSSVMDASELFDLLQDIARHLGYTIVRMP